MLNFDEISQYMADIIKPLPVSEKNGPYWNYVSCFDFDVYAVIHMSFCMSLPNFVVIGRSAAEL